MKNKIISILKYIFLIIVIMILAIYISTNIMNNLSIAHSRDDDCDRINLKTFAQKSYDELLDYDMDDLKDIHIMNSDDVWRQNYKKTMCIHNSSIENTSGAYFFVSGIIDINKIDEDGNSTISKAENLAKNKSINKQMNAIMAYICYYAENVESNTSNYTTLWSFRRIYNSWCNDVVSQLGIDYFKENYSTTTQELTAYKNGVIYKDFIFDNYGDGTNSVLDVKGQDITSNTKKFSTNRNGNLIGPLYYHAAIDSKNSGVINNRITCYVNNEEYKGDYYNASGNKLNKTLEQLNSTDKTSPQAFYIKVNDIDDTSDIKVKIQNKFYQYRARIFICDGGGSQTNTILSGKRENYSSNIVYSVNLKNDVEIDKYITGLWKGSEFTKSNVKGRKNKETSIKEENPVNVQVGDVVEYTIRVINHGNNEVSNIKLNDVFDTNVFELYTGNTDVLNGTDFTRITKTGQITLKVSASSTKIYKIYLKVKKIDPNGVKQNNATITVANNSRGNKTSDSDYVKILDYDFDIKKVVNRIYRKDNSTIVYDRETSAGTPKVEPGDIVQYKITINNNSSAKIYNISVQDIIPEGMTYYSKSTQWSKDNATSTYSYSAIKANGVVNLYIKAKVISDAHIKYDTITNKAEITQVKNRNGIDITEKLSDSAAVDVLKYEYNIKKEVNAIYKPDGKTKTGSIEVAEPGEIIEYKISVNNTGTANMYVSLTDIIKTSISDKVLLDLETDADRITYTNEMVEAGKTKNFIIKTVPISKITNTKYTVTNEVTLNSAKNINDISVIKNTGNFYSVDVTILGYDATLNKYITKHNGNNVSGRNLKTNEEKNNSPVVMKKGDTFTYTIVFKNTGTESTTGNTTLYQPQIVDALPAGVEYVSHSNTWEKSGNTYTYNGNVGIGTPVILEINCRVTMSNMYLFNLENTASYGTVNNRNSKDTKSVLKTEENKDYIRLDELLIAGNVWKDDNRDGLNNSESGIKNVLVYLRDATNDNILARTETGKIEGKGDGYYCFENIEKGTNKDATTGNYADNAEYRQYYVEFVYDGIDYRSTIYTGTKDSNGNYIYEDVEKGQGHLTGDGNYEDDYLIDSNATEIYKDRALINNALETISYNESNGSEGTIALEYGKNDNISRINKSKLKEDIREILTATDREEDEKLKPIDADDLSANNIVVNISSYSFMNENGDRNNLWLYPTGIDPIGANSLPETDYLQHINLGLTTRDGFDLSLTNKVEEIETVVNGQSMKYDFSNIETIEEFMLYNSDYGFRHDNIQTDLSDAAEEALKNIISGLKQGEASELNIFVTFKTTIKNNSTYAYAKVKEIAQFYDHNFKTYGETVTIGIDKNKDGVMEPENTQTRETTAYIKGQTGNNIDITNIGTESSVTYNDKDLHELKVLYIGTDYNLAPQEEMYIYITYIVDKEGATRNLKINNGTAGFDAQLQYISIIGQYSSYDDASASRIAGLIDDNSNPGNLGLRNNGEGTTEYVKNTEDETKKYDGKQYSEKYFENDTHICGIKFLLDYKRKLSGFTWEDARTETKEDGHRVGNGIFNEDDEDIYGKSDTPIGDITIQLVEVIKDGNNYYEVIRQQTTSASNGNYLIEDFIPGKYIVRFRYGNNDTNIDFNGQDYKSTTYTLNPETYEALTQDATISDARDDELRRLEVMNYSLEMYNEKAEILKGIETSNSTELIDKTNMFADTVQFFSDYELLKQASGSLIEKDIISLIKDSVKWDVEGGIEYTRNLDYEIKNIDFGIQERPKSTIELEKRIKQIKLETSSGDLLVDLHYDENSDLIEADSKGFENVQALNNTSTHQGFRYINIDEDLLQGAKISIIYGFKAINNSEVDHVGANLYGEQSIVDTLNTAQVLGKMTDAINELDNLDTIDETTVDYEIRKNNYKYRNLRTGGAYSYGYYLGGIYYTGAKTDDVIATIKVDNILDYVDNSLVFSPIDNGGTWGTALEQELILNGYLNPNVARYIDETETDEDEQIKTYDELKASGYQYFENETNYGFTLGGITFEGSIVDINQVGYQANIDNGAGEEEIKNNLAVTVDDPTLNGTLSIQLYPDITGGNSTATTELMVSTFLSSENESDDMVYENIAEIIKFTTLTGRRTISAQTVGNAKIYEAGYIDDGEERIDLDGDGNVDKIVNTLGEPDTSITEKVMLTPPTGADWIDTYVLTRVIIYVVGSVGVVVLGILFIPKLVTKIKNRKFIK